MIPINVHLSTKTLREISELRELLDISNAEIIRECVENDLPRFRDRHRKAIREAKTLS